MKTTTKIWILSIIASIFFSVNISLAQNTETTQNIKNTKNITLTKIVNNPLLINKITTPTQNIFPPKCVIKKLPNNNYLVNLICLQQPIFSTENFTQNIDKLRPYIQDFDQDYDLNNNSFNYSGNAQPIFKNRKTQQKYNTLKKIVKNLNTHYWIFQLDPNKKIELTSNEIALADMQHYSFYPARRFIHELWPCARINYRIATASIDKKFVPAQQDFNVNKRIAFRRGYCKGKDSPIRPFYWWSCGASTQVFRISLLHPFLETHDRENHGIWYSRYYGKEITGDDSSIIDFRQKLTLKNTSEKPVYFRYLEVEKDKNVLLIGISPKKFNKTIKITKYQTWPLSAKLTKSIYWPQSCESYQERNSKYRLVDDGFTE